MIEPEDEELQQDTIDTPAEHEPEAPQSVVEEVVSEIRQKLEDELHEVRVKYHALCDFIRSEAHSRLHVIEQGLLGEQSELLHKLIVTIERRIDRLL